jgi:hypothetical protein
VSCFPPKRGVNPDDQSLRSDNLGGGHDSNHEEQDSRSRTSSRDSKKGGRSEQAKADGALKKIAKTVIKEFR